MSTYQHEMNPCNSFNKMIGLNWIIYNPYMIHWNKNNSKYIWRSTSFLYFYFLKRVVQLLKWVKLYIIISRFHKSFQLNILNGSSDDFFNDINRQSNSTRHDLIIKLIRQIIVCHSFNKQVEFEFTFPTRVLNGLDLNFFSTMTRLIPWHYTNLTQSINWQHFSNL